MPTALPSGVDGEAGNMKREEVRAIFPNATDEEVDNILNEFGKELNPLKKQLKDAEGERDTAKAALSTARANETSYKQQLEEAQAKIDAGLSDEERTAQREKAAEDREREFTLKSNGLDAKSIFVAAGCFEAEEIDSLADQVTVIDPEQTKARAKLIVDTVIRQREAAVTQTQDDLLKGNPKPQGGDKGGGNIPTTVKEFLALDYKEQLALKEADPNILSQLKKD